MEVIGHWNKFHDIQQVKLISIEQNVTAVLIEYSFHWQWWGISSLLGFVQITQMQMIFFSPALIPDLALPVNDQLHSVLASSKFKIPAYKHHCELYSVHSPCSQEHMNQIWK